MYAKIHRETRKTIIAHLSEPFHDAQKGRNKTKHVTLAPLMLSSMPIVKRPVLPVVFRLIQ